MTKARRVLADSMPTQDVVIEVLDARMPGASENPVLAELRGQKACVKVLSKSDLADPAVTSAWVTALTRDVPKTVAVALTTDNPGEARRKIAAICQSLVVRSARSEKPIRAVIVGIPNVGKSTLINTLMNRKVAKTGDEPAVTKSAQVAVLPSGMVLTDHPGLMWPNVSDDRASLCLALGGAIPDTALDFEIVALFAAKFFLEHYGTLLRARYGLGALPATPEDLLDAIGRKRGGLRSGGRVDRHKAADVLVHDFRTGKLGRISLQRPRAMFTREEPPPVADEQ
jgi:ribosome biogenesis GTPase A